MPTISMFYGILVAMYVLDTDKHHHPHIHIRYNEFKAVLRIPDGEVLNGELPNRQMKLVQAWIELHQDELMADWHWPALVKRRSRLIPCGECGVMTPDVIKVVATPEYSLVAEFESGEVRHFDMRPYLKFPAYAALKEPGLFMRAHVRYGTVVWNEEIDLSPDTLYLRGTVA